MTPDLHAQSLGRAAPASVRLGSREARDLGIAIGDLEPGPLNAITDVAGVRVGHTTLVEGDDVRTGVTVVVPRAELAACSPRRSGSTATAR